MPILSPGDLRIPEIEPTSPALAGRFFPTEPQGSPYITLKVYNIAAAFWVYSVGRNFTVSTCLSRWSLLSHTILSFIFVILLTIFIHTSIYLLTC